MIERVPDIYCAKGHLIPANKTVTEKEQGRLEVSDNLDRAGKSRKCSLIACEECAIEAGGILVVPRRPMARPDQLEVLGQGKITGPVMWIE